MKEINKIEEPQFYCPICNFRGLFEPAYYLELGQNEPKYGSGNYDICPCCGFQFNLSDYEYPSIKDAVVDYRKKWVQNGCVFFSKTKMPENWDAKKQLAGLRELKYYCRIRK